MYFYRHCMMVRTRLVILDKVMRINYSIDSRTSQHVSYHYILLYIWTKLFSSIFVDDDNYITLLPVNGIVPTHTFINAGFVDVSNQFSH